MDLSVQMIGTHTCIDCDTPIPPNHILCAQCAAFRTCRKCKRALRRMHFENDNVLCNGCIKKQSGGGGMRIGIQQSLGGIFVTESIETDGVDITSSRPVVANILEEYLVAQRFVHYFIWLIM